MASMWQWMQCTALRTNYWIASTNFGKMEAFAAAFFARIELQAVA